MERPVFYANSELVDGGELPWSVTNERGQEVARFKNRLDSELFMHAWPVIRFGATLPAELLEDLKARE